MRARAGPEEANQRRGNCGVKGDDSTAAPGSSARMHDVASIPERTAGKKGKPARACLVRSPPYACVMATRVRTLTAALASFVMRNHLSGPDLRLHQPAALRDQPGRGRPAPLGRGHGLGHSVLGFKDLGRERDPLHL